METLKYDFVIVGSGLAGIAAAYLLSSHGSVLLLSKDFPTESNSFAAQGGMAAAIGMDDNVNLHAKDTLETGNGLSDPRAVQCLAETAPRIVHWLQEIGVSFDQSSTGQISLGLEGAHSRRRILHAGGDATGRKLMEALMVALKERPNIHQLVNMHVLTLLQNQNGRVIGARAQFANRTQEKIEFYARRAVILATGGVGQLFQKTTNPRGATGDGLVLAYDAGASLRNLEFIQFHPTTLYFNGFPAFLISEAVRGAGGILVDDFGEAVMKDYPLRDLEARDLVARKIYQRMQEGRHVYLDCRHIQNFQQKFPNIFARCISYGIHPTRDLLPVFPAAHFMMGGIATEMNGQTDVEGLYAIGEVACTGAHGANRLASNSLLECLVMAFALDEHFRSENNEESEVNVSLTQYQMERIPDSQELLDQVQKVMWKAVGIVRDQCSLDKGLKTIVELQQKHPQSGLLCTARWIIASAISRQESRGAHFREDFPVPDPRLHHVDTWLRREEFPSIYKDACDDFNISQKIRRLSVVMAEV